MKRLESGIGVLRPLVLGIILGILVGGVGTGLFLSEKARQREVKRREAEQRRAEERKARQLAVKPRDWLREHFRDTPCSWCYMTAGEDGWCANSISNLSQLKELVNKSDKEIVIPVFPTVYMPRNEDKVYYDAILESDIEPGDKVLVIGTGSGSDAWVAWLKSQSLVYVVEVNPMAVANAKATARIGNFQIKPVLGDITDVDLPEDFSDFDYVLWNMPFLTDLTEGQSLRKDIMEEKNFHDGDDGSILKSFLARLPSLLKKDGKAILLNTDEAIRFIDVPNLTTKKDRDVMVYIIPNDAA